MMGAEPGRPNELSPITRIDYTFMRRALASERAGELYAKRHGMAEPVFADTKFNRRCDRFQRLRSSAQPAASVSAQVPPPHADHLDQPARPLFATATTKRGSVVTASAPRLPIGLDHGCAAKTWATAPPLKTVGLIDSMVSGAVKSRSPAPTTTGWMTRRYSSIRPVATSDRANRGPPWASRYPPERSCLSRVTASVRSPAAISVSPQSADASELENTTLGISFIASANGPEAPGQ